MYSDNTGLELMEMNIMFNCLAPTAPDTLGYVHKYI